MYYLIFCFLEKQFWNFWQVHPKVRLLNYQQIFYYKIVDVFTNVLYGEEQPKDFYVWGLGSLLL